MSQRTCVGCRRTDSRDALVRFVIANDPPFIAPDLRHRLSGRGVSVHPDRQCLRAALERGGFARAVHHALTLDFATVLQQLVAQYEARTTGLLLAGLRTRQVSFGTDVVTELLQNRKSQLLLLAADAAGRRDDLVRHATEVGIATLVWSNKRDLGRLAGREEIAVLSIQDPGLAGAVTESIKRAHALLEER